jgi:hypothetical protein
MSADFVTVDWRLRLRIADFEIVDWMIEARLPNHQARISITNRQSPSAIVSHKIGTHQSAIRNRL